MSVWQVVPGALLAWAFLGLVMGLVMGQGGHDPAAGLVVGPFVVPLVRRG